MGSGLYSARRGILLVLLAHIGLLIPARADAQEVKRGRYEGAYHVGSSNVAGSGNITAYASLGSGISHTALHADARLGGLIGLADILHMRAEASLLDFQILGPVSASLKATTPGNDRLRFLGAALSADLYLPTSQDTIAMTADSSKPEYNPSLLASAVIDCDWLALYERLPLKTFLRASLADNPQLLYKYNQVQCIGGAEWKLYRHSLFVEMTLALYREKAHKLNDFRADAGFEQQYLRIAPGFRYRVRNRFSLVGALTVTAWSRTKARAPLHPDIARLALRFEAPLLFRETNAEAVRSLVFMEQQRDTTRGDMARAMDAREGVLREYSHMLEGLQLEDETFDYTRETEALRERREQIQKRMKEIEQLLKETE